MSLALAVPSVFTPGVTSDLLCQLVARVLATRSTPDGWVLWAPYTPFGNALALLGLTPYLDTAWCLLLDQGWIEKRYVRDTLAFRLTDLGQAMTRTPLPPLPRNPSWFQYALHHFPFPPSSRTSL